MGRGATALTGEASIAPVQRALPRLRSALVLIALVSIATAPTWLTSAPAALDYANHLARAHLLYRDLVGAAHPYYEVAWKIYPNLAMDIVVPRLGRWIGVDEALHVFLFVSQLIIFSGAVALEKIAKGKIEFAPFVAAITMHAIPFELGFLNFQFGLGVVLWCLAAQLATSRWPWFARLAVHGVFCAIIYFCHFFAFGVYGFVLGILLLQRIIAFRAGLREAACETLLLATPAFVIAAVMLVAGQGVGGAEVGAEGDSDLIRALRRGAGDSFSQTGRQAVGQGLSVPPTLTIRPGTPVRLLVTQDLILEPYQEPAP